MIKIDESKEMVQPKEFPKLIYSPEAYVKIDWLLMYVKTEIAWHALVKKLHDKEKNQDIYYIYDIICYPQIISSVTVDTDDDEYCNFLMNLPIEKAADMKMQSHSHNKMSIIPSGRDLKNQKEIIESSPKKDFYIFGIYNDRWHMDCRIYDFQRNIMFDNDHIDFDYLGWERNEKIVTLGDWFDEEIRPNLKEKSNNEEKENKDGSV